MMEPSEECILRNEGNPEEEQVVEEGHEEEGEQVLGIIDIQNPEDATLILQQEGLDLNGQHIFIGQDGVNGDYFVVVHESLPGDESEVVLEHKDDLDNVENPLQVDDLKAENFSQAIGNHESVYVEQINLPSNSSRMGGVRYHASLREDSEGRIYFPTSSDSSTEDTAVTSSHGRLLHLAAVAQELQSAGENSANSQHIQDFQCSQSIPEGSVIVNQNHADTDSAYRASETEVSSSTDLASEQDSQCGIAGTSRNIPNDLSRNERRTSFSCISSTRNIDNAVSVIHTTSSTYAAEDSEIEPGSSNLSNDYDLRHESDAKSDKSEDSVPSPDNCSNPNDNFSNQDEDSVLSRNSGLDLTKEPIPDNPACDEDSYPAVGQHSRSRYGIMDSLNKDKQNPYYDTNTSDEIEDTVNSSTPSADGTDDVESASENNSNEIESNKDEEVTSENNISNEALSPKNENFDGKCQNVILEACDGSERESSQDSKEVNKKKRSTRSGASDGSEPESSQDSKKINKKKRSTRSKACDGSEPESSQDSKKMNKTQRSTRSEACDGSEPESSQDSKKINKKKRSTRSEACDGSEPESSQDSKKINKKKRSTRSGLDKKRLRSFHSSSNDNSKCSELSENGPSSSGLSSDRKSFRSKQNAKRVMDAYDFEESSSNAENNTKPLPSLERKVPEEGINHSNACDEDAEDESASKLTFHEAFSSVLEKEESNIKNDSANSDHSAELFENTPNLEENNEFCEMENPEKLVTYESMHLKQHVYNIAENASVENLDTQYSVSELCSIEQNNLLDPVDTDEDLTEKTLNGFEGDSVKLPQKVYTRKRKVELDLVEPPKKTYTRKRKGENYTVKPPQKTYITKKKEENDLVKPPTRTYIRKKTFENYNNNVENVPENVEGDENKIENDKDKIELFSCDDLSSAKEKTNSFNVDSQKDTGNAWVNVLEMDDDGMESNVQSKVSATYKRKPKNVPPVVRANRTRSLRPRSSKVSDSEAESEAADSSLRDLGEHLISQDKEEDANWGDILMRTQFTSDPIPTDVPTASSSSPNSSSPSRKRKRPAWFTTQNSKKSQLTSGKQFDKLIKSSPLKVQCRNVNEKKKLRDKIKKQAMSLCNNLSSTHKVPKRGRPKIKVVRDPNREISAVSSAATVKRCKITYLCERPSSGSRPVNSGSLTFNETNSSEYQELFHCSNKCGFVCTKINNLILHRKVCSSEFDSSELDSSNLFCDMDKRQRIRGETKNKEKEWNEPSTSSDWQDSQPSCSKTYERKCSNKEKIEKTDAEERFGFAEKDIVWVKRGRQHWPALVWEIREQDALFYVITSPNQNEPLTLKVDSLKKNVHSFDDVEWSKKLLEGNQKNKNSNFLKAVQKANSYIRKKVLSESRFDAKEFFDIKDDSTKPTESSGSEMDSEHPYTDPVVYDKEEIDIDKVLECIFRGDCDDHVVSIYNKTAVSERNKLFCNENKEIKQRLEDISWFGPFKADSDMQLELYDHFYELYKRNVVGGHNVSYIYKVWIPEGIIKAISLVNRIPFQEAELVFLRQDAVDRVNSYDPFEGNSPTSSLTETSHNSSSRETLQTVVEAAQTSPEASPSSP